MRVNIHLNRALIVDVWRSAQGEVQALGHDIEPRSVLAALDRAVAAMRRSLQQRGANLSDVDKELEGLAALGLKPGEPPADWRRAVEILRGVVYSLGERLRVPGEDVVEVEIGDAPVGMPN